MRRNTTLRSGCAALALLAAVAGCDNREHTEAIGASRTPSIKTQDLKDGAGQKADIGDRVKVHYVATLPDGSVVLDTRSKGRPQEWTVGGGTVITGVDQGVRGMRPGGKRRVRIPPSLHWGSAGYGGVIPEDTWLNFELELVSVQ